MTLALMLLLRSTVVLGVGLLAAARLGGRSAALRHCVIAAAVAAAALVAPFSLVLPVWPLKLPPVPFSTSGPEPRAVVTIETAPPRAAAAQDSPPAATTARSVIAVVWLTGFFAAAAALLAEVVRLRRIAARAALVRDHRWNRIAADVARGHGLRGDIELLQTDAPDLLATWGVVRPSVLLPSHAREWSDDRLRIVLSHEFAHIRRHDWFVQMAAETLRTVCWFNPLMWIACTRLRRESEQACDDAVLAGGVPAPVYAAHLLELARICRRPRPVLVAGMPMAHPSTLERRIAAMLNSRLDHTGLSRRAVLAIAAALLAVSVPVASLSAGQRGPATLAGSVYDTTGAVMPGVAVTLEDATQNKTAVASDATGHFEFPRIAPGRYVLAAAVPGFKALRQEFELANAADWDRAITLQLGTLQETISVSASRVAPPPAPSRPQFAEPLRVGGNVRAPRKLTDVRPIYPASMRAAGREGVVPIEAIIGRDGSVASVRVLSAQVHPDFAIAAADAVRQWRFSPTLLNGAPVEVVMTVSVSFHLSD